MLFNQINKNEKKIAIYFNENNTVVYKDLIKEADFFLKNIKERNLVILIAENNIETIFAYFALMKSDNVIMILDSNTKNNDIKIIIERYSPGYIYCSKKIAKFIYNYNFNKIFSFLKFDLLKSKSIRKYEIFKDLKILMSTSGSLGEPKFVKLSNTNLKTNTESIISYLKLNFLDRTITTMPMSYSYGLSVINTHLLCGASIVLNNRSIVDKSFWKLYSDTSPSNINGVPFFYNLLLRIGLDRILNPNLRFITQAGGRLSKNSFEKIFKETFENNIKFFLMYGQTEASPRISYHQAEKEDLKLKNLPIGKAVPGGEILIKNEKKEIVTDNNIDGDLYYRGKNIFGGYSKSFKDLDKFTFLNELETGDIGYRNLRGNFFITGRKSRFIKVYGYRLNLDYVEEKINSDEINQVACVGFQDILYIFSKKIIVDLEKFVILPKDSFKIIIIKEFPLNSNGKISYKELIKKIIRNFKQVKN